MWGWAESTEKKISSFQERTFNGRERKASKQTKERSKGYVRRWEGSRLVVEINKTGKKVGLELDSYFEDDAQRRPHGGSGIWKNAWEGHRDEGVNMRILGGRPSRQRPHVVKDMRWERSCAFREQQKAREASGQKKVMALAGSLVTNPLGRSVSLRVMGRDWGTSSRRGTWSDFHLKGIPLAVFEDRFLRACPCRGASLIAQSVENLPS